MKRAVTAITVSTVLVLLAIFTLTPVVQALFIDPFAPNRPRVDCGKVENIICRECCYGGIGCPGAEPGSRIFCCRDPDDCDVIDPPQDAQSFPNIRLDMVAGGSRLVFKRKERFDRSSGQRYFEITLQQIFRPLGRRSAYTLTAELAGADAAVGSLLYAVGFLTGGPNALAALQTYGYDISLVNPRAAQTTCPAAFSETCALLANQLTQSIIASLAIGTDERTPFLQGLQALNPTP
jgi:hypothetical protein